MKSMPSAPKLDVGLRGLPLAPNLFVDYVWTEKESAPMKLSSQFKPISYLKTHAS